MLAGFCEFIQKTIIYSTLFVTIVLLSRDRPTFYLNNFHVASLNQTLISSTSDTTTTTIYFDLGIENENLGWGLFYNHPTNLTFTYFPPNSTTNITIGEYTLQGFYQGIGKVKHVRDFVVVQDLFSSAAVDHRTELRETHVALTDRAKVVLFGVNLDAKVKFKSIEKMRLDLKARGIAEVNGNTGDTVQKKTVELKYGPGSNKWGVVQWLVFFPLLVFLLVIGMSCFVCLPMYLIKIRLLGYKQPNHDQ